MVEPLGKELTPKVRVNDTLAGLNAVCGIE